MNILKRVDHPNIIRLQDLFETEEFLYIVTELYVAVAIAIAIAISSLPLLLPLLSSPSNNLLNTTASRVASCSTASSPRARTPSAMPPS